MKYKQRDHWVGVPAPPGGGGGGGESSTCMVCGVKVRQHRSMGD